MTGDPAGFRWLPWAAVRGRLHRSTASDSQSDFVLFNVESAFPHVFTLVCLFGTVAAVLGGRRRDAVDVRATILFLLVSLLGNLAGREKRNLD